MSYLVLFDLDSTLLQPADPLHSRAFAEAMEALCGRPTPLDFADTSGLVDKFILSVLLERAGWKRAATRPILDRGCRIMAESYLRGPFDDLPDRVLPGVRPLLAALAERGVTMGVVTGNVTEIGWHRLEREGLRRHFAAGAFGDEALRRSTLVRRAIRRCTQAADQDFAPDGVTLVGDTPRDIKAAHRAGARCVAVATGHYDVAELGKHRPAAVLDDLVGLDIALRAIAG